jgi:peptidyl-prolyl cis-trans isomerase SurA
VLNALRVVIFLFLSAGWIFAQDGSIILDKIISKVDNQILLKSEYDVAYLQALQQDKKFKFDVTPCVVLEKLLTDKLLLAKAEIDSIVVDEKQVESELDRRMEYFVQSIGSKEKLEAYYNKTVNQLKSELRKQVKEQLVIKKMQDNITAKIKVTPSEVKRFYASIPKDSLPFFSKEFEIGHIVQLPKVSKDQKNLIREKLNNVRKLVIEQGESFERLAKELSEDPQSAREGGILGFFKKGDLVPEYEAAALKLRPNETSPVIESQFGFHIIQLIERRGNEFNSRHILLKPSSSSSDLQSSEHFLDSIRTLILADSISFEKAAKEYSDERATKETGGIISDPESGSSKIPAEKIDPTLYFILDTMKVGNITRPIPYRTEDGKEAFRIVYFKSVSLPHQANLKDDYLKIQFATVQEKKNKAINTWFNKTKGEVFIQSDPEFSNCDILKGIQ